MVDSPAGERGRLHVIAGPMFSGKTDSLIERLDAYGRAGASVLAVKPLLDGRYGAGRLVSHSGRTHTARSIDQSRPDAVELSGFDVVGIDEVQFFAPSIASVASRLRELGCAVVAAGLDLDFLRRPFESTLALLARADTVERRTAVCGRCGAAASLTQRLVEGVPAPRDEPRIRIGSADLYQPRCPRCFDEEQALVAAAAARAPESVRR